MPSGATYHPHTTARCHNNTTGCTSHCSRQIAPAVSTTRSAATGDTQSARPVDRGFPARCHPTSPSHACPGLSGTRGACLDYHLRSPAPRTHSATPWDKTACNARVKPTDVASRIVPTVPPPHSTWTAQCGAYRIKPDMIFGGDTGWVSSWTVGMSTVRFVLAIPICALVMATVT